MTGYIRPDGRDRAWTMLERAADRWRRRRRAWRDATAGMAFEDAIGHPGWRLVEQANALLLRLGRVE